MASKEDASETSGIGSMAMPPESGAINFQATPDSDRKVRTECVPPPLPHCPNSTPASVGSAAATPAPPKRSNTAPHKLETYEPLQHSPEPPQYSPEPPSSATPSTSPSASLPGGACGGPDLSDADPSDAIEKNNAGDGGEFDRHESSPSIAGGRDRQSISYSRDRDGAKFEIQAPITETVAALAECLADKVNSASIDDKQPQAQAQQPSNEQQKSLHYNISPPIMIKKKNVE